MFEVLVAFGASGTVTHAQLLAALSALDEKALVVGHVAGKGKAQTRWFTLVGHAERSAEALVAELVATFGSLTVVAAYDSSGLVAVLHHVSGDDGVETTVEVVEDSASQAKVLGRELPKLHGKQAVKELQAAVEHWTYVHTVDGTPVPDADERLDWAIDVGEASDIVFRADDDDDDDTDDADEADDDSHVIAESEAARERRKQPVSALFGEPDRIEDALAASKACRAQGDFTWHNVEHYALQSRRRWAELTDLHRDRIAFARNRDRYGTDLGHRETRAREALRDATEILRGGDKAAATVLVEQVLALYPSLRARGDYYDALLDATIGKPAKKPKRSRTKAKPTSSAKPKRGAKTGPKRGGRA